MGTGRLTKESVDALQPGERDTFLWDARLSGFGLKVTPAGRKVYLLQYRMGGRGAVTRRYTIGAHGNPWTPAKAKEEAERLLQLVRKGEDPLAIKGERERVAQDLGFAGYAERFLANEVRVNWRRSYADVERILRLHARPVLKNKPVPLIKKSDVGAVLARLPAEKVALRRKVWAVLSRLFSWAVEEGDLDRSPLETSKPPPSPLSRDRVLHDWELRLAWLASGDLGYPFGPLYRLLIATGQRREEVSGLDWRELHKTAAEWHLPAARAKNEVATVIPLSPLAVAELDSIATSDKWPRRGLVFSTTGKTAVSGYSRGKARLDKAMLALAQEEARGAGEDPELVQIEPWRVHDLRRTCATGLQKLGVRFEVVEAILNHVSGSKSGVAAIYQRHDWREEKPVALRAWASHLQKLMHGSDESNVISLAGRPS